MSTMKHERRPEPGADPEGPQEPPQEVIDRLAGLLPEGALEDAVKGLGPEELSGPGGLLSQLAGRVVEAALEAEMTDHLGHPPGGVPQGSNVRNGYTAKRVQTDLGPVEVNTPRDRQGRFEPQILPKRVTRLAGLDDKVLGLYAGGMTVRDISHHLSELYGTEIGRDTISRITDAVLADVRGVAHPALGRGLSDRLLRRDAGEGPRGPLGAQHGLLPRAGGDLRRRARGSGHLVAGDRGRQVLAGRPQRSAPPRRPGCLDRLRRRAHRLPRGDRGDLPADLHRPLCRPSGYADWGGKLAANSEIGGRSIGIIRRR